MVKRIAIILISLFFSTTFSGIAQCSICTKTAQQLGEGPASGMNSGIIYLAFIPLLAIILIGFRWWKSEKNR